ncbi:hypothetical protein BHE74_00052708 [Ensete ventricosum]|nr:hypothetical protein BHE74_00052708 [Ensete ventricosum]
MEPIHARDRHGRRGGGPVAAPSPCSVAVPRPQQTLESLPGRLVSDSIGLPDDLNPNRSSPSVSLAGTLILKSREAELNSQKHLNRRRWRGSLHDGAAKGTGGVRAAWEG